MQVALWSATALLLLGAAGTAGYAELRQVGMGIGLAAGGSDARGEAWRRAQLSRRARAEYEEDLRLERQTVAEEQALHRRLLLVSLVMAAGGGASAVAAWRQRRPA